MLHVLLDVVRNYAFLLLSKMKFTGWKQQIPSGCARKCLGTNLALSTCWNATVFKQTAFSDLQRNCIVKYYSSFHVLLYIHFLTFERWWADVGMFSLINTDGSIPGTLLGKFFQTLPRGQKGLVFRLGWKEHTSLANGSILYTVSHTCSPAYHPSKLGNPPCVLSNHLWELECQCSHAVLVLQPSPLMVTKDAILCCNYTYTLTKLYSVRTLKSLSLRQCE